MKKRLSLCLFITIINFSYSQTTLTEGDMAITGVISDNPDEFSFILLTDVSNGTSINFTDKSWHSTGGFIQNSYENNTPEGIVTWTTTSDLPCGTEIIISNINGTNTFTATIGTAIESENGFALTNTAETPGDQLIAFQNSLNNPTFLYAVHFGNTNGWTNATDLYNSAVPAGLTAGINAIDLGHFENHKYLGTVTTNKILILQNLALINTSNWYQTNSNTTTNRPALGGHTYTCSLANSCTGLTTTWNGSSWDNGIPDLTMSAIISANYSTNLTSFKTCSLTINSGATLTVENNTFIEIENDVTVNGNLIVENQGNFVQNSPDGIFILNSLGTAIVNKETAIKDKWYYYTYWSSPIIDETIGNVFPNVDDDRRFYFEAANFVDNNSDDIDDNGDDWQYALDSTTMTPGIGFACTSSHLNTFPSTDQISFYGTFNTGAITTTISKNNTNIGIAWNLIGNPYPSAIDFVAFQQANATVIDGAAYFWSQASPPSRNNLGDQQLNFSKNDYATYTIGSGGAAGASTKIPTKYIPSAQSFFISGLTNSTVTFTNAMRMADGTSNSQFFKNITTNKNTEVLDNKLWINLTSNNGVFNQILIAYVDGATNKNDGLAYDAPRIINQDSPAVLYSSIDNDTHKYVIQGKSPESINNDDIIKLGFITHIDVATIYSLSLENVQGDYLTNNSVYLKDNLLNKTHNLTASDYNFTSEVGEFDSRFEVVFQDATLDLENEALNANAVKMIQLKNNNVQFKTTNNSQIKTVTIFDALGRKLYDLKVNSDSKTFNLPNLSSVFMASIKLSNGTVVTKKGISK